MKKIVLAIVILFIAGASYAFAAEPSNPAPVRSRAEIMAQIYRNDGTEVQSPGDSGTSSGSDAGTSTGD